MGKYCKAGQRVKMSAERLREQTLPPGTQSGLIRDMVGSKLAAHACATHWDYEGRQIC